MMLSEWKVTQTELLLVLNFGGATLSQSLQRGRKRRGRVERERMGEGNLLRNCVVLKVLQSENVVRVVFLAVFWRNFDFLDLQNSILN